MFSQLMILECYTQFIHLNKKEKMVPMLLLVLATTSVAVSQVKECPPWFESLNTAHSCGDCFCAKEVPRFIQCDERKQRTLILQGTCVFYDSKENRTIGTYCPFIFPESSTENGMFPLPANVSELNSVVCGNLGREVKGPLCGRCTNGTGPSIYSVASQCAPCSPVNILYYLLLQYLPSTVIFVLVIIFRPNITSAPMAPYVIFCNCSVLYYRILLWRYFIQKDSIATHYMAKFPVTLSAIWSIDALLFVSPPLCISQHIEEIYIPLLEFLAAIYPFFLLFLTYGLMKLYGQDFKPIVALWKVFRRVYVQCYRAWDPQSSMIQAFASLMFLSLAKLSFFIWEIFVRTYFIDDKGKTIKVGLYIDPNVPYFSTKHILLMAFSVAVALLFLPPLLILVVYPTSLYRKISHWISPKWRLRIKTYVEIFHSSFKDGTNGTRDYRSLSVWFFPLGIIALVLYGLVHKLTPELRVGITYSYMMAIFMLLSAFLCMLFQPYKENISNILSAGILLIASLLFTTESFIVDNQRSGVGKIVMIVLLLIPHCLLWGHVVWKLLKFSARKYCLKKSERISLLSEQS